MVRFAKSLRLPKECSSGRSASRVMALAITVIVHLLVAALFLWGGLKPHPRNAASDTMYVVLIAGSPSIPVDQADVPEPATHRPVEVRSTASRPNPAPKLPEVVLKKTKTPPPGLAAPDLALPQAAAQPPRPSQSEVVTEYRQLLFERLAAQRHYPEAARLKHYQGNGAVLFRIDRSGLLLSTSMERSTGKSILDRAAITQVRSAAPFPEIPAELPDELAISMPLQFLIMQTGRQVATK